MQKLFYYPKKNLTTVIPIVLVIGFITGLIFNTSFLKEYILILTVLMIYPTMIGFNYKSMVDFKNSKVVVFSVLINFLFIPFLAYVFGILFFKNNMDMFAGMAIASLLPTSGMTISWTMINKGNVSAAVKITALSLILGSLIAPLYLVPMVGQYISIDIIKTFIKIIQVVLIPLILGFITYKIILIKTTEENFKKKIKPALPASSIWFLLVLIFISISMKAKVIISETELILWGVLVLIAFYAINYFVATIVGKTFFGKDNAIALVYSTVMRNLSLALGIAVTSFGPKAALLVTLAYIIQVQSASWYGNNLVNKIFKD